MLLATYYDGVEIHRAEKIIYARFLTPHRVISTCRSSAGGIHDHLDYLYNHQSCEPGGHHLSSDLHRLAVHEPDAYRAAIANRHDLPPECCATMGTAANMQAAAIAHEVFRDLEVVAVCTGGVESNAGRAGDPASYHEEGGEYVFLPSPNAGTIVIMLCISRELAPGTMVEAVTMATEAKTAVLQEYSIPSCYSSRLATGTGTDQIGIAARLGGNSLRGAQKHTKLGELIGRAVQTALRQTLARQNGLTPVSQCSSLALLRRLGTDSSRLSTAICDHLSPDDAALLRRNLLVVLNDPPTVAAVAALLHLYDQFCWGVLPLSCLPDVLMPYVAQIATAVAGRSQPSAGYQQQLAFHPVSLIPDTILDLVARAFALGFSDKWPS
ncbi:adenosylcobinamide amidohydrolase [Candidatus Oscillochloris fontis]|uniref:adenosylcobinamide amidohydrolase n=1 Tax=Candidatus Oscillochloris fontis TaxID=2496868 RepID=UPI00101D0F01|nr:adenosylcobinamide amidohydrolase [Candidatus Oscillochloris fontis]